VELDSDDRNIERARYLRPPSNREKDGIARRIIERSVFRDRPGGVHAEPAERAYHISPAKM